MLTSAQRRRRCRSRPSSAAFSPSTYRSWRTCALRRRAMKSSLRTFRSRGLTTERGERSRSSCGWWLAHEALRKDPHRRAARIGKFSRMRESATAGRPWSVRHSMLVGRRIRAYLSQTFERLLIVPDSVIPSTRSRVRPAVWTGAGIVGALTGATILLWAHYGSAVFFEMIVAGLAFCF
jgi:hypothetical protein